MANVKQGNLTAPREWWKHMDWEKRVFWKRERKAQKAAMPGRLDDDYTYEEFMADICTDEAPCDLCLASNAEDKKTNAKRRVSDTAAA